MSTTRNLSATGVVKSQQKALLRLLRLLLRGPCEIDEAAEGMLRLGEEKDRLFAQDVVLKAQALGLARRSGSRLGATDVAAAFVRRALVGEEEAFAGQHRTVVGSTAEIGGELQSVRRNLSESPLGLIARMKDREGRPFLPPEAVDAGEKLLAEFTRAQLQPRVTASWEPRLCTRGKGQAGGQVDIADSALAARDRFAQAMDAMGPELAGVAVDVCCFSKGLETVERERQWPARSAKLMLRTALLALARHYAPPKGSNRRRRHFWGAEGYRPLI